MNADNPQHASATNQFHTGAFSEARPSMGAWISYGLGTENQNLPSFVSIHAPGMRTYGSGFLPAAHLGTPLTVPLDKLHDDANMEGMIQNLELAFRMQTTAPQLVDLSSESQATLDIYGVGSGNPIDTHGCEHQPRVSVRGWLAVASKAASPGAKPIRWATA